MDNKFEELLSLNVNGKTEKRKSGSTELTYLSWAWAWAEFKKVYPDASYEIRTFKTEKGEQLPYMYDEKTGYMVMTTVVAGDLRYDMWLPVMDSNNNAMKDKPYEYTTKYGTKTVDAADMFDINKTIMRCLVKNLAMFGLGLYIYAGEDLPPKQENEQIEEPATPQQVSQVFKAKRISFKVDDMRREIENCPTARMLADIYDKNEKFINDTPELLNLISERGRELSDRGAA